MTEVREGLGGLARRVDSPFGRESELGALLGRLDDAPIPTAPARHPLRAAAGVGKSRVTARVHPHQLEERYRPRPAGSVSPLRARDDDLTVGNELRTCAAPSTTRDPFSPSRTKASEKILEFLPQSDESPKLVKERISAAIGLSDADTGHAGDVLGDAPPARDPRRRRNWQSWSSRTSTGPMPTFLDLLEHVRDTASAHRSSSSAQPGTSWSRSTPEWSGDAPLTSSGLRSSPLGLGDGEAVVANLLGSLGVPRRGPGTASRSTAEGNPLYRRADAVDAGRGRHCSCGRTAVWSPHRLTWQTIDIPPTISALISRAARPAGPARSATSIERGAVIGQTFWAGAVAALMPADLEPVIVPAPPER